MPLRRRDARDRLTFELVESSEVDADEEVDDGLAGRPSWGALSGSGTGDGRGVASSWSGAAVPVDRSGTSPPRATETLDLAGTPDGAAGEAAAPDAPTDGSPPRRGRRTAVVAAVSAGVALVLGGMLAVDAWHGRVDLDRLRAAPGGVEPMPDAPVERWTADVALSNGIGLLPATVVTVVDGSAVGVSLDTGEERWRVDVGASATCGSPYLWTLPSGEPDTTIVCLAPVVTTEAGDALADDELTIDPWTGRVDASAWAVTVVDESGAVVGRRDVDAEGGIPSPGPEGVLVRTERVGEVPAGDGAVLEQDLATGEPADIPPGRPAVVRVEDALTGAARWEAELPFVERTGQCVAWSGIEGDETIRAELENIWTMAEARLVRVEGCGVSAWFTPDGTRLDEVDSPSDGVVALPDGTYYRDPTGNDFGWGNGPTTDTGAVPAILEADGSVRWEPPGRVLVPTSTDGSPGPVLVQEGADLVALDAEGTELWRTSEVGSPEVRVVASGTVVVSNGYGSDVLVAFESATGRQRWSLEAGTAQLLPGSEGDGGWGIDATYTDGTRVIVSVTDWDAERTVLTAFDLADGRVAWRSDLPHEGGSSWMLPLQGRLLRSGETTISRLG